MALLLWNASTQRSCCITCLIPAPPTAVLTMTTAKKSQWPQGKGTLMSNVQLHPMQRDTFSLVSHNSGVIIIIFFKRPHDVSYRGKEAIRELLLEVVFFLSLHSVNFHYFPLFFIT